MSLQVHTHKSGNPKVMYHRELFICLFVCKDVLDLKSALTIIQLSHFTRSENGFQST